jgi:hypothetical protein
MLIKAFPLLNSILSSLKLLIKSNFSNSTFILPQVEERRPEIMHPSLKQSYPT